MSDLVNHLLEQYYGFSKDSAEKSLSLHECVGSEENDRLIGKQSTEDTNSDNAETEEQVLTNALKVYKL